MIVALGLALLPWIASPYAAAQRLDAGAPAPRPSPPAGQDDAGATPDAARRPGEAGAREGASPGAAEPAPPQPEAGAPRTAPDAPSRPPGAEDEAAAEQDAAAPSREGDEPTSAGTSELEQSETGQSETGQSETGQSGTGQSGTGQSEAAASEPAGSAPPGEASPAGDQPLGAAGSPAGAAASQGVSERAGDEARRRIEYVLEAIEVRGNDRTDAGAILPYVPLRRGEVLDVDDPRIETIRWRLLGTGWFHEVRLSLERGTRRGHVKLIVEVRERNTFVVQSVAFGISEGLLNSDDPTTQVEPYFGLSVAELNLFGTGVGVQATGVFSGAQQGVRLRAGQASVGGSEWGLSGALFFNNGREFFGHDDVIVSLDECPEREPGEPRCEESPNAVVDYRRYGASIGTSTDLGTTLRFTLDWQFEAVELVDRPAAASRLRGSEITPIDFAIHDGWSFVSALRPGLIHDERDDPGLTTEGRLIFLEADVSTTLIGSSYDFVRVRAGWREWFRLPEARHAVRLGLFVGAAVGDTPFFYRFYVSDLSDLIPSRMLELNLDRRSPPNLLDTSVREMRAQELAGRVDVEYSLWLYEGHDEVRGLVVYGLVGLYALLDREDLRVAIPGYEGFARAPIDLTFDVGLRLDTVVGVFELGFSTLLGFVSL